MLRTSPEALIGFSAATMQRLRDRNQKCCSWAAKSGAKCAAEYVGSAPQSAFIEVHDFRNDRVLLAGAERVEERQPQQALAETLGDGTLSWPAAEFEPHRREVQRHVVEDGVDRAILQVPNQLGPLFRAARDQIKEVI